MSPLLRALTFSRTAHEPVTDGDALQCYTALDHSGAAEARGICI
jgi:hypothetical protein